jgi:GH24 family phage-related lysozyme (muramidase)
MDLVKTKRLLHVQEDIVLHAYDDATGLRVKAPKGHITIGCGHNLDAKGISPRVSDMMLEDDIHDWVVGYNNSLQFFDKLSDVRQAALISIAHNCGMHGALEFVDMLLYMSEGNFEKAAEELINSDAGRSPKTARRYHDLAKMIATDEWVFV